jgi:xanthine/uracil permease
MERRRTGMLKLMAVVIGLVLGLLATAAYACNDPVDTTVKTPSPQVQLPPPDTQT